MEDRYIPGKSFRVGDIVCLYAVSTRLIGTYIDCVVDGDSVSYIIEDSMGTRHTIVGDNSTRVYFKSNFPAYRYMKFKPIPQEMQNLIVRTFRGLLSTFMDYERTEKFRLSYEMGVSVTSYSFEGNSAIERFVYRSQNQPNGVPAVSLLLDNAVECKEKVINRYKIAVESSSAGIMVCRSGIYVRVRLFQSTDFGLCSINPSDVALKILEGYSGEVLRDSRGYWFRLEGVVGSSISSDVGTVVSWLEENEIVAIKSYKERHREGTIYGIWDMEIIE